MGAPAVQYLEHWTLVSTDIERTRRFYVDVMGAATPPRATGPASVTFAGTVIDFFPASEHQKPEPGSGGQHHAYAIRLEDYDAWERHLKAVGWPYRRTTHGLGRMSIYVDDPDGFHLELTVLFPDDETGRTEITKRGLLDTVAPDRR